MITSGGAGDTFFVSLVEGQTLVTDVAASGAPGTTVTYRIAGGADASRFTIDPATGRLSFVVAPDFEAPSDSDGDNVYQVIVSASDGSFSDTQTLNVMVADRSVAGRLIAFSGFAGAVGGTTSVFVNSGFQDIEIIDVPGTITFNGASGGDDIIRFAGEASAYTIARVGSRVEITDGDTRVSIPLSATGINLAFADGPRTLAIVGNQVQIGSQAVSNTGTAITAPAETDPLPNLANPAVRGQLIVAEGSPVIIEGNVDVFGTSFDVERLTIADGNVAIRVGFTGGSDTIGFVGPASGYTAVRVGSNVIIEGGDNRVSIPVSQDGVTLSFQDGNQLLRLQGSSGQVLLGTTQITNSPVLVDLGEPRPVITSSATAIVAENLIIAYDANAINPGGGSITYSLLGVDAALFNINASTGLVTFKTAPNFEAPADAGANNQYNLIVRASNGTLSGDQAVTITVVNVNEAPTITSPVTATVNENQTAAYAAIAADPDAGATLTFSLSGADAGLFSINSSTGVVTFKTAPNFEAPGDADGNNQYQIAVTATDASGFSANQAVTINVANVNEAPVITSGATGSIAENAANSTVAYDANATDVDAGTVLTFSLLAGGDSASFDINPTTGAVVLRAPADFETKNSYTITVRATDNGSPALFDDQTVTINVTNLNEAGSSFGLASLDGINGFRIDGVGSYDRSGVSVASAGDINGDGFEDLIIGAYGVNRNRANYIGESYVVFGKAGNFGASVGLADLDGTNGFRLEGIKELDFTGFSVASAGDVNGDGFDDLIIGAPWADPRGRGYGGETYVVFGTADNFGASLDLSTLNGTNGFRIDGINGFDLSGTSVASAGDINGDGFDDLIIGAPGSPRFSGTSGNSYVVFGTAGGFGVSIDLVDLNGTNGFRIAGIDPGDQSGRSVASAGDVNGDGFDDLIIGIYRNAGAAETGESYVVFGKAGSFGAVFDLADLNGSNGFRIDGVDIGDFSGRSVASAGDVNGDGFDDLVIGAIGATSNGYSFAGESYVVFGKASGFAASLKLATLNGTNGFRLEGTDPGGRTGFSVASAGDVNGDGFDDLIIGAYTAGNDQAGESYVVFGKAGNFGASLDLSTLNGTNGFQIDGIDVIDRSGRSVASAGDVNGDGFDDLIIGADRAGPSDERDERLAGESYVIFGGATGTEDFAPVTRSGTAAVNNFTGNAGNDTFTGIGAGDVVRGGAGDDNISITTTGFADIDGGRGTDTLALVGSGLSLNLTTTPRPRLDSIEVINLTGTGNNSLTVSERAIYQLTEQRSAGEATLIVRGNSGDSVTALGFTANGAQVVDGITYNRFERGNANLLVESGVTVTTSAAGAFAGESLAIAPISLIEMLAFVGSISVHDNGSIAVGEHFPLSFNIPFESFSPGG